MLSIDEALAYVASIDEHCKRCEYCDMPRRDWPRVRSNSAIYCSWWCRDRDEAENVRFRWRRQDVNRPEVQAWIEKNKALARDAIRERRAA